MLAVEECANLGIITFPELPMAWLMRKEGCKELRKQGNKARESDSDQTRRGSEMYLVPVQNVFPGCLGGKIPENPGLLHVRSHRQKGHGLHIQAEEPSSKNQGLPA